MDLTPFHGPPASVPQIPGFAARTLLGFGAHGEVWLAEDLSDGTHVAVKIGHLLRAGPQRRQAPEMERETAVLSRIDHPHIVRLRRVVTLADHRVALVLDLAAGGSLAALVAGRGRLAAGEVATMVIPLIDALAHLHGLGLVHGDLAPGNVLFSGAGRPLLGDLGVARMLGARSIEMWTTPGFTDPALERPVGERPDERAADFWGLAAVAWFGLTGGPPESPPNLADGLTGSAEVLAGVLADCLGPDPAGRPRPDELRTLIWAAAEPAAIQLIDQEGARPADPAAGLPPISRQITRRRRDGPPFDDPPKVSADTREPLVRGPSSRPAVLLRTGSGGSWRSRLTAASGSGRRAGRSGVVALAGLSLVFGGAGLALRLHDASATTRLPKPEPSAGSQAAQLSVALDRIGRARASAFSTLSLAVLLQADQPGSPAEQADLTLIRRLRERGCRLEGVKYDVAGVQVLGRDGVAVRVRAVVTTSGHQQVRIDSRESAPVPADGPRAVVFTVVPVAAAGAADWRVENVSATT